MGPPCSDGSVPPGSAGTHAATPAFSGSRSPRVEVRTVRWLIVALGLTVAFLQGCSSGTGSSMTGPSSQTSTQPAGSDASGGRTGMESGNQMM